ncbi:MAG TPA: Na+/H+ antiporter subunit C [Gammaproteobacteria bacterium]|nr:Na+/H+ antiporter subunit C [Gammaproteobacteria bacterium]
MEYLVSLSIGVLTATGVFLTLRARTFPVVLGLTLLAYAVNLFLFSMGRLTIGLPAIIDKTAKAAQYSDPLPQALVLTAIVIAFGMTAFLIVLALKARGELASDHVDGLADNQQIAGQQNIVKNSDPDKGAAE